MNQYQFIAATNLLGLKINITNGNIVEVKQPYENYLQVLKDGLSWEYSEINVERKPGPQKENFVNFNNEEQVLQYFFIHLLKKSYLKEMFPPNNPAHQIKDLNELTQYLYARGVTDEYFSFDYTKPNEIYGDVDSNHHIEISFINSLNQKSFTTMLLPLNRGIFAMYRFTYSLFLLKQVEKRLLEENIINKSFSDWDIELFIK
ncbi:hypothetical protein [Fictibacillus phosphorivorans]|uniref:hypothetical protein n=1 Tax=Fictibacillus phosphorivorans TaxID=1221500 RepID=UPI0012936783|nr:hypothetical protein [Fictibacillus phosphorivorans]MQR96026.1 hypothetical protein [Fictibacillus phosphorivorans]